ncbi:MAG: hypothetical protein RBU37_18940 [Myxococcota bacterium]|jgi:hypothetical protein|nr:hypothetical protein [Myxococcota bacterium]
MRRERKLDMMPLLDIFMTVLFLFATIQEGQIEVQTYEAIDLEAAFAAEKVRADTLAKAIDDAQLEERRQELENTSIALASERERNMQLATQLATVKSQKSDAEAALAEAQLKLSSLEKQAREQLQKVFKSADQFRKDDVLDKLLDQQMVFEVEIKGVIDPVQGVINHCCFRSDPRSLSWTPCGTIPAEEALRAQWFSTGADGLLAALRATKGGNAVTIIRQDASSSYLIGDKIATSIRGQIPEQKVYNEGIVAAGMSCRVPDATD